MTPTFGIEEEFALLDPHFLETVDLGDRAIRELSDAAGEGVVVHEFFRSQVEYNSAVFDSAVDAGRAIRDFRRRLADWADHAGVVAAGSGTPFRTGLGVGVTGDTRYESIAADIGGLIPDHQINGLHIHVGISDPDEGIRISNALRPWLPALLALSADSPFWQGEDTRFESWRAIHGRRWTTHGIPPHFRDAGAYRSTVSSLLGVGATSDEGALNWTVRLSRRHPTVEVRICDAQLDADSAIGLAVLVRALAASIHDTTVLAEPAVGLWDAALWHAARHGLTADLVDPASGGLLPAAQVVAKLRTAAAPGLHRLGDLDLADRFLRRVLSTGTGSTVQRRSRRAGIPALAELYRTALRKPSGVVDSRLARSGTGSSS